MALVTESNKKTVDILATALLGCAILYFFYNKNKGKFNKTDWYVIGAGIILGYIVITQVTKSLVTAGAKPPGKDIPEDYLTDENFSPTAITNGLAEAIDDDVWSGSYHTESYSAALGLSNAELTMVYNDWTERFFGEFGNRTLTQALENHTIYELVADGWDADAVRDSLVSRLKALNYN